MDRAGDFHSVPLRSFVACAVLLATSAITPADVVLKGQVGSRVINDDVIIARGTTCMLNGTTIKGNVRVRSGAKLYANGAWVDGTVFAYNSLLLDFRNASRVTWGIRANGARSILLRGRTRVGGNVSLSNGSAPVGVDVLQVQSCFITGNIWAGSCTGSLRVINNAIEGKLGFSENSAGPYAIRNNEVWNNIEIVRNNGKGSILDNTVGGDLVSKDNTPNPVIRGNVVRGDKFIE